MASRQAQVTILSEDRQHEVFVRRLLDALRFDPGKFRFITSPGARGSAEQFVREHYADQLQGHRRRSSRMSVRLIVVIDADRLTLKERRDDLASALRAANEPGLSDDEPVAILIPKRNIETWIHYLGGQPVDELTAYPKLVREGKCQPAVDKLVEFYQSGWQLPDDCPDSLRQGIEEWKRIL